MKRSVLILFVGQPCGPTFIDSFQPSSVVQQKDPIISFFESNHQLKTELPRRMFLFFNCDVAMKSEGFAAVCLAWYFLIITVCAIGVFQMYIFSLETLTKCPDDELEYDAIHQSLDHRSPPVSQTPLM